jgi:hypothetical protein
MMIICQDKSQLFSLIQSLTNNARLVLKAITIRVNRYGNGVRISVKHLARELGCCTKTVSRAIRLFYDLGIIQKENIVKAGWIQCLRITLTEFFSREGVRVAMYSLLGFATTFLIDIKMLFPVKSPLCVILRIKNLNPAGRKVRDLERDCISKQKKAGVVKKMTENLARKVLCIEAALLERGEGADMIDTPKLLAFSERCLDNAAKEMKLASPKYPFRYYLKLCFDYAKDNGEKPDYELSDMVRSDGLLDPYRQAVRDSLAQKKAVTARYGLAHKKTYAEEIKERNDIQRRVDEESRKRSEEVMKRKQAQWKPLTPEEKSRTNIDNPFFALLFKSQIDRLKNIEWESDEALAIRKELGEWGSPL